jgi:PAS domain S-box-containing protein
MKIFSNLRIKNKIIIIIVIIGALSTITGNLINYYYDIKNSKNELISNTILHAKLISENLWFPIEFNYSKNAKEILQQLHTIPDIHDCILYTQNDTIFASYHKSEMNIQQMPEKLKKINYFIEGNYLHLKQPVTHLDKNYGTLYIRTFIDWTFIIDRRVKVSLIIISLMLGIIFILAYFMQRYISFPIISLTNKMNIVAKNKDYTIQIQNKSHDEIGELYNGFNYMITEINRREKELETAYMSLATNEQWLRIVMEKTPLPISMINTAGIITFRNERFVKLFGFTEADMTTITQWWQLAYPEEQYRKQVIETWENLVWQALEKNTDIKSNEYIVTCKNGKKLNVIISGIMLGDTLLATFVDLTERKKIEEELRQHRNHLEELVSERTRELKYSLSLINAAMNSTADGILIVNRNGHIALWNQKFVDLWQVPVELLNTEIKDPVLNHVVQQMAKPDQFLAKVIELYQHPEVYSIDLLYLADGRVFERYSQPQKIGSDIVGRVWSFRDITERILAEENLRQAKVAAETANHAKSEFLSNMSHELRTPLNAILGFSKLLKYQKNITDSQKEQLTTVHQCGEHLLSLINDILDMSKIEAHKLELSMGEVCLPEILRTIFNINKVKADEKDLEYVLEKKVSLPNYVMGDERKLKQIMLNLINNAIKFTDEGRITIRVDFIESESTFIFEVEDTGIGIPTEKQTEIFEPFTQHPGKRLFSEGTGLGLSITKKLIEMMDGTLNLLSEPDKGSVFKAEIPLQKIDEVELEKFQIENNIRAYSGDRKKILVVDDNQSNVSLLVSLLTPIDFIIEIAENGQIALQKVMSFKPDLVLLDYRMPVMNGLEFAHIIKSDQSLINIKIIGISATVHQKELKKQFHDSCNDFIPKPVDTDLLLIKIQELLQIEWIYESKPEKNSNIEGNDLLFPEKNTILLIIENAEMGDFNSINQIIDHIVRENSLYEKFCTFMKKLTKNYDSESIIKFLQLNTKDTD